MYHSLLFLLNAPAGARAGFRYIGAMAEDPGNREWLEVTASGFKSTVKIGFDRSTGLPTVVRRTGTLGEAVDTLSGHRAVDGILFPFVIEDRLGDNYAVTNDLGYPRQLERHSRRFRAPLSLPALRAVSRRPAAAGRPRRGPTVRGGSCRPRHG